MFLLLSSGLQQSGLVFIFFSIKYNKKIFKKNFHLMNERFFCLKKKKETI